jgi:hypothetical protein
MDAFMLGLFSAVLRWLRVDGVGPLKIKLATQIPDGLLQVVNGVGSWLATSAADVFHSVSQVEVQSPGFNHFDRLIRCVAPVVSRMVHVFHTFHSRPARARRQPQTVLEPRWKRQHIGILALLAFASPLAAQSTGFIGDLFQKTAPATSAPFNNSNPKYNAWTVMYSYVGSGNFSIEFDCAPDATTPGGTPTPGAFITCTNTVTGSNPSTQANGNFGYFTFVGYTPWLETKINSISSGSITVIAVGFPAADPESGGGGSGGCVGTTGTPCIVAGPTAVGSAPTKNPVDIAGLDGAGNVTPIVACTLSAVINVNTMGENQILALSSGKTIRVCGIDVSFPTPAAFTLQVDYGTGSNCASGTGHLTGIYTFNSAVLGFFLDPGALSPMLPPASNAVCLNLNSAVSVQGTVFYAIPF